MRKITRHYVSILKIHSQLLTNKLASGLGGGGDQGGKLGKTTENKRGRHASTRLTRFHIIRTRVYNYKFVMDADLTVSSRSKETNHFCFWNDDEKRKKPMALSKETNNREMRPLDNRWLRFWTIDYVEKLNARDDFSSLSYVSTCIMYKMYK